nr:hypothetical protein Q903MT_gene5345 [Picea sitchensis]
MFLLKLRGLTNPFPPRCPLFLSNSLTGRARTCLLLPICLNRLFNEYLNPALVFFIFRDRSLQIPDSLASFP